MILADHTVFRSAINEDRRGVRALVNDLISRGELAAPGPVFAALLMEFEARHHLDMIRDWATKMAFIEVNIYAWLAAGDLGAHLADLELALEQVDLLMSALSIREKAPLWTFNRLYEQITTRAPVTLYQPLGI
ncbi:hypothetical protein KKF91_07945 [Myxococcota bacterium]|nr:hypothetical protein [Myxococcota bacterium]MBU1430476.1 hypothetical protein [Myxococcota bacterium]MBU1900062.1 hypothetical protein [Myxococcota bacterium]